VATRPAGRRALALVLVDAEGTEATAPLDQTIDGALDRFRAAIPEGVDAEISPYTALVYEARRDDGVHVGRRYALRQPPDEPWVLGADVMCAFTDCVQLRHSALAAHLSADTSERTLARALADFLTGTAGSGWGLHYYTGSMIAGEEPDRAAPAPQRQCSRLAVHLAMRPGNLDNDLGAVRKLGRRDRVTATRVQRGGEPQPERLPHLLDQPWQLSEPGPGGCVSF
jgi:hypothetical protein